MTNLHDINKSVQHGACLQRQDGKARQRTVDQRCRAALTPAAIEAARLRAADPSGRYAPLVAELERLAAWDADAARRRWRRAGWRA